MFAPQVLSAAGFSGLDVSLISNGISASVNMGATIPALFLVSQKEWIIWPPFDIVTPSI
jgi:hypothetical protein